MKAGKPCHKQEQKAILGQAQPLLLPGAAPWMESPSSRLGSALGRMFPLLPQAGLGMAAPPQCCCIRELLRSMLLARKEKKHHDFMEKSKHQRSRGTEREGFIQKQICNQNQVRRHSQKSQENKRNQNKTVRVGKRTWKSKRKALVERPGRLETSYKTKGRREQTQIQQRAGFTRKL